MNHSDPVSVLAAQMQFVLVLMDSKAPTAEMYRKVRGTCQDMARLAGAEESRLKRQERLDAALAVKKAAPYVHCCGARS